jgi:hypothetical protein
MDYTLPTSEELTNAKISVMKYINDTVPGYVSEWCKGPDIASYPADMEPILNELVDKFVSAWKSGPVQRTPEWYYLVGKTIGGSEIAAILGIDKYKGPDKVIEGKTDILTNPIKVEVNNLQFSIACQWGIVFEDVITRVVERDLHTTVKGESICVQIMDGHRTSPDGYAVVTIDEDGRLVSTYGKGCAIFLDDGNSNPIRDGHGSRYNRMTDLGSRGYKTARNRRSSVFSASGRKIVALLEFKCPLMRRPNGVIPTNYVSQVLSGLAVSPCAHMGVFVDGMFRVCSVDQVNGSNVYNTTLHTDYKRIYWAPICWGVIGIYAPTLSAPLNVRYARYLDKTETTDVSAYIVEKLMYVDHEELVDFGGVNDMTHFENMFDCLNRKMVKLYRPKPVFKGDTFDMGLIRNELEENTPEHYGLIGVLGWKLFSIDYSFVRRDNDFLDKIKPVIDDIHSRIKKKASMSMTTPTPANTAFPHDTSSM